MGCFSYHPFHQISHDHRHLGKVASVPFFQTLVLKSEEASEPPREPVKTRMAGPTHSASHSVSPGWGPSICIANNFQVLLLPVLRPHFENHFLRQFWIIAIKPSLLRKPQSLPFTATLMCRQQGILYTSPWPVADRMCKITQPLSGAAMHRLLIQPCVTEQTKRCSSWVQGSQHELVRTGSLRSCIYHTWQAG